jgi:integrase/recombinase XerD
MENVEGLNTTTTDIEAYLEQMRTRKYSPRTIALARFTLDDFQAFLTGQHRAGWQDVLPNDLEHYRRCLIERPVQLSTLEVFMRIVRQFFRWLEQTQRLFVNPAAELIIPKNPRRLMPVPTEAEVKKLLAQPDVRRPNGLRDRAFIELAYSTGARLEELLRLSIFDPDFRQRTVRLVGKGNKERVVPIGKHAAFWLQRYLTDARPRLVRDRVDESGLWIGVRRNRLCAGAADVMMRNRSRWAGIQTPISPHALRRACATHMLQRGAHVMELKMLLGHSTFRTLSQYLRLTITDVRKMHARSKPGR